MTPATRMMMTRTMSSPNASSPPPPPPPPSTHHLLTNQISHLTPASHLLLCFPPSYFSQSGSPFSSSISPPPHQLSPSAYSCPLSYHMLVPLLLSRTFSPLPPFSAALLRSTSSHPS